MFSKKILIAAATFTALIATGCAVSNGSISEESLGLRKTNLYTEDNVVPDQTSYSKAAPGESKPVNRAFENAPPMIPHDVEGMLPITRDNNSCLGCHSPEVAKAVGALPVPKSHLFDMRTQTVLATVSNARFNCSQCHAPQSNLKPLVKNEFQPEFRTKNGNKRSNLLDTLNEGVQ